MSLALYNTLSRQKETFTPSDPKRVTMYVCGPTVYSYAHIGNARPAVVFDVLYRVLSHLYPQVIYARNITDIDDRIIKASAEQNIAIEAITEKFTRIYQDDMVALGVLSPSIEPKATDTLPEMIAMIEGLIAAGHAYAAEGHVLFDVLSFADYGKLSKRNRDDLIAGARVEVAPYKKDPADFVLWKPSNDDQPGWDSPWGRGRPGWHLECSCMIEKHLGETIDIHGGGHDLIFPHHENEIAQSTCAHNGALYVRYWMHNGFVNVDKEKMSKSIGNVLLVHNLLETAPGEAIRFALLNAHYRQPLDWTDAGLAQAKKTLDGLYGALRRLADVEAATDVDVPEDFLATLEDDLNTPKAIAYLAGLAKDANTAESTAQKALVKAQLITCGALLGFLQQDPEAWFQSSSSVDVDEAKIEALIEERKDARANKDFAHSDAIRDELDAMGVAIEDTPDGTIWKVKD